MERIRGLGRPGSHCRLCVCCACACVVFRGGHAMFGALIADPVPLHQREEEEECHQQSREPGGQIRGEFETWQSDMRGGTVTFWQLGGGRVVSYADTVCVSGGWSKTNRWWETSSNHTRNNVFLTAGLCQLLPVGSAGKCRIFEVCRRADERVILHIHGVSHESSRALQNESKYTEKRLQQADGSDWKSSLKWKYILLCSDADSLRLCLW